MVGYVYILASKPRGTLYIGVTSNLVQRVFEHKEGPVDGFTRRYRVKTLVYYELFDRIEDAIVREKDLKRWKRTWKLALVDEHNPDWHDLYPGLHG